MSDTTPRLGLPDMPDTPELYADKVSDAFWQLDAVTDLYLKGQFVNDPPGSASDGDVYLVGGAPASGWGSDTDFTYKLACRRDGAWRALAPFDGLRAYVATSGSFIVYCDGVWTDWNSMLSAAETSVASAATCDIGAADSLFLQITGATDITSFGAVANKLRYLCFAGALTLTHDATALMLPGGADIVTAAGDTALFTSDSGGNWRCRLYSRASGLPVSLANPTVTGTLTAAAANFSGAVGSTAGIKNTIAGQIENDVSQDNLTSFQVTNDNAGGAAAAAYRGYNGTTYFDVGVYGHSFTTAGVRIADWAYFDANIGSASGIAFQAPVFTWAAGGGTTEGMRFAADGSLLVGTITAGGWTGAARIAAVNSSLAMSAEGTDGGSGIYVSVASTDAALMGFYHNTSTLVGAITTNATTTTYGTTSDARLKVVDAEQPGLGNVIRQLWVGGFEKWGNFQHVGGHSPGFGVLAQQAYNVLPANIRDLAVVKPKDENTAWAASSEPFAFLALWGVKDLYAMIAALAARVAALEAAHDAG